MWKRRALYSSMLTLLSKAEITAYEKPQYHCIYLYSPRNIPHLFSTYTVQLSPGLIAWRKHGVGAFAFNFSPQP